MPPVDIKQTRAANGSSKLSPRYPSASSIRAAWLAHLSPGFCVIRQHLESDTLSHPRMHGGTRSDAEGLQVVVRGRRCSNPKYCLGMPLRPVDDGEVNDGNPAACPVEVGPGV